MTPEHPDDDALSALLDGEATPEEAAHVEACSTCSARLDELRRAAELIARPLDPVSDEARTAAISAALDAQVVSLEARRRRRPPAWLVGAAAVALLGLGLVPLLNRDAGRDTDTVAGGDAALDAPMAEEESSATMFGAAGPVDAGDLGPVAPGEVQDRVTAALLAPPAAGTAGGGSGDDGGEAAAPRATDTMATAPPCETEIRDVDASAGELRLTGRATFDGRPAVLLLFEQVGVDSRELRVYVVAADDCGAILHTESFPAP